MFASGEFGATTRLRLLNPSARGGLCRYASVEVFESMENAAPDLPVDYEEREVVLRADFDEVDDEGGLWVSFRFLRGPRPPRVGETIYLVEPGGRGCLARVQSVNGWVARVMPETPPRR